MSSNGKKVNRLQADIIENRNPDLEFIQVSKKLQGSQEFVNDDPKDFAQMKDIEGFNDFYDTQNAAIEVLSSYDLSDKFLPLTKRPLRILYAKNLNNDFLLAYEYPNNRISQWRFAKDSDGLMRAFNAEIGNKQTLNVITGEGAQVVKTGVFSNSANTWYTTEIGATLEGSFIGTGFKFYSKKDDRGGIWRFVIDGGSPIDISVWRSITNDSLDPNKVDPVTGPASIDVISGLDLGVHHVLATFIGADPSHAPSSGPARGWVNWNATVPLPIRIISLGDSLQLPQGQLSPTLVGTFLGLAGNSYTLTVGNQLTGTFTGTGLEFVTYKDTRGGLWNFKIDGGADIPISTWDTVAGEQKVMIVSGLTNTTHTFVATFAGADPAHIPTDTPRGWFMYYTDYPYTFIIYPVIPKDTKNMLATGSVMEWAINCTPEGSGFPPNWQPKHSGELNVSREIDIKIYVDGANVVISNADNALVLADTVKLVYSELKSFDLEQTFKAFNGNDFAGTKKLWDAETHFIQNPYGKIGHRYRFKVPEFWGSEPALGVNTGTGHLIMLPATTSVDRVGNSRLEEQSSGAVGAVVNFPSKASGMYALYTPDKYYFYAQALLPLSTWGILLGNNANKDFYFTHRTDTEKGYFQSIVDTVIPPGTTIEGYNEFMIGEYDGADVVQDDEVITLSESSLETDEDDLLYVPVETYGKKVLMVAYKKTSDTKTNRINSDMIKEDENWYPRLRIYGFDSTEPQTIKITLI